MSKIERPGDLRQPTLTLIGHIPLITPRPVDQLHPATMARVLEVEAMLDRNDIGGACRLVLAIEADLGITTDDRIAAVNATEPWEIDLEGTIALAAATANGSALSAKRATPRPKVELPEHERGFSKYQIARFDKLTKDAARETDPEKRDDILKLRAEWADLPRQRREKSALSRATVETVALAEGRGEEVSTTKGGAKLIITHDGLWNLHERRRLTIEQYEEGCAYRRDRDRRTEDMGSQLGGAGMRGSAHNNHQFVASRHSRAEASSMIAIIDRAVAMRCPPNSLAMLRSVAGEGQSITVWGKGRSLELNALDLAAALDVAAAARKAEEKRRRDRAKDKLDPEPNSAQSCQHS